MLQQTLFETSDPSTSSAVASPARTLARQEKALASKAKGAASGTKCCESLSRLDLVGYWLKMSLLLEAEARTQCSLVWKRQATPSGRAWWVLGRLVRHTKGIGCGSWPTVHGNQGTNGPSGTELGNARKGELLLGGQARKWPTPVANDDNKTPEAHLRMKANMPGGPRRQITSLNELVKSESGNWPTPQANDDESLGENSPGHSPQLRHVPDLLAGPPDPANLNTNGKPRGSLNSMWVSQLMGWPEEYAAELTKALCEYWATVGATPSRSPSSRRSRKSMGG